MLYPNDSWMTSSWEKSSWHQWNWKGHLQKKICDIASQKFHLQVLREGSYSWINVHSDFNPSTPKSDQFQISPAQPHQKYYIQHSMKNLAFHSFPEMKDGYLPILTASLVQLSLKGWGNVHFELEWKG